MLDFGNLGTLKYLIFVCFFSQNPVGAGKMGDFGNLGTLKYLIFYAKSHYGG